MTGPRARWLSAQEVPPDLERPCVWLLRDDDPEWEALVARLRPTALDLADAALFASPERSAARLRRRLLSKALVGRVFGVAPAAVVVERSSAGAIAVIAPRPAGASLSARDGWTMLGLFRSRVGVDVEAETPPAPAPLDLLHPEEARAIAGLEADRRAAAFARFWAVKEAVLKAAGQGLNADPTGLCARFDGDLAVVCTAGGATPFGYAEVRRLGPGFAAVAVLA